jgi:uncharacterized protein (TIGR03382 family)
MKRSAFVSSILLLLVATPALGQPLDAGTEISALESEVDRSEVETQTSDCPTACRALQSMRKAADRICALEPGPPCERARQRVARAEERVRAACPECTASQGEEEKRATTPKEAPAPTESYAAAPPAAPQKGRGCAGCATTSTSTDGGILLAYGALALAASLRRRRR